MPFKTSYSAVFWADTSEDAQATIDALTAVLPTADQASVLTTIALGVPAPPLAPIVLPERS